MHTLPNIRFPQLEQRTFVFGRSHMHLFLEAPRLAMPRPSVIQPRIKRFVN